VNPNHALDLAVLAVLLLAAVLGWLEWKRR